MIKPFTIHIPSKTFLVGEYLALEQYCGIVINTMPTFQLQAQLNQTSEVQTQFAKHSPAGSFYQENLNLFKNVNFNFVDPYLEAGGFGASSAQFIALAVLKSFLENDKQLLSEQQIKNIHQTYLTIIEKNGSRASGVDVIGQCLGNIALIDCQNNLYQSSPWPFQELSFLLFKTPFKIKTHEHLSKLTTIPTDTLRKIFDRIVNAFHTADQHMFLTQVQHYAQTLQQQNLILKEISDFCFLISKTFPNTISKGCGALGADVILVLANKQQKTEIKSWIEQHSMRFIVDEENLSPCRYLL